MGRVFCWDDCLCGNSEYGHPGDCVLGDRHGSPVFILCLCVSDRAVVFLYCSSVQVEFGEDFVCSSLYGGRADYGGLCESDSHADVSGYIVSCKTTA